VSLLDALFRALAPSRRAADEAQRQTLRQQMDALEREHGSAKAAAGAAGVSRSTWWRWRSGRQAPRPGSAQGVRAAQRARLVPPAAQRQAARATAPTRDAGGVRVTGMFTVSADRRQRSVVISSGDGRDHVRQARVAFMVGDDATAEAELQAAVNAAFGQYAGRDIDVEVTDPVISWE